MSVSMVGYRACPLQGRPLVDHSLATITSQWAHDRGGAAGRHDSAGCVLEALATSHVQCSAVRAVRAVQSALQAVGVAESQILSSAV